MSTFTLLVDNTLLLRQLEDAAALALANGRFVRVLPDNSGSATATLVQVELSAEDFNTILEADKFANAQGKEPAISVTEYAPE